MARVTHHKPGKYAQYKQGGLVIGNATNTPQQGDLFEPTPADVREPTPTDMRTEVPVEARDAKASSRLLHFEECQHAIDQLFAKSYQSEGDAAFLKYLEFTRKISNLSIYNAMLARVQRPGMTAVASRHKWREDFKRSVRLDAVPIVILWPFGPVQFVYDIADTEGPPMAGADANPLYAIGALDMKSYRRVCDGARIHGVEIVETDQYGELLAGTAAGCADLPESMPAKFRIKLNARHSLPTRFATLAHELGHVYCGHVGGDPKDRWPNRMGLTLAQKELEAEAVAWLVCQRNGVTSRSADYLKTLITPEAVDGVSMYTIFDAANRAEARMPPSSSMRVPLENRSHQGRIALDAP